MNRPWVVCLLLAFASVGLADPPAYRLRDKQMEYHGPERETEQATKTNDIHIAWFGPDSIDHPEGGDLWCAAQLAIERANASGGYQGNKFRLLPVWSETPWDEVARQLTELVYRDGVVAIVGGMDGPSTHVAEQIAAKARLPVISPVSTDKSINLAGVPWIFSCLPGDHLLAPLLADSIARTGTARRIVLLSSTDHDAHLFSVELRAAFRKHKIGLTHHYDFAPDTTETDVLAQRAIEAAADSVVVVADTVASAELVAALRGAGFQGTVYCGPEAARRRFVEIAKTAAEGVIAPLPANELVSREAREFSKVFRKRCDREPDFAAAQTYDAVLMLVAAIRKVGPNRVRIADALRELSPYHGVAGTIQWDRVGANTREGQLGGYRNGHLLHSE